MVFETLQSNESSAFDIYRRFKFPVAGKREFENDYNGECHQAQAASRGRAASSGT